MERMQRAFKGIWIPKEIWLSEQLSLIEKVLFVEISSLDNERGCFASNAYFAAFFGISDRQIRNVIASLKSKGFVTVIVRNKNERVIRVVGKYRRVANIEAQALITRSRETLTSKWRLPRTSDGVGRKVPGR